MEKLDVDSSLDGWSSKPGSSGDLKGPKLYRCYVVAELLGDQKVYPLEEPIAVYAGPFLLAG